MKLSASTLAFSGHDFATACDTIAACGFAYVEPAFIEGYGDFDDAEINVENAGVLKTQAEVVGLSCRSVSAHVDMSAADAVPRMVRRLDFAAALEARYLVTNAGPAGTDDLFAANLEKIAPLAEARNVVICIENPGHGSSLFPTGAAMAAWKRRIGHPFIDLNYDFGNIFTASDERLDPADDLRAVAETAAHFHVKDLLSDAWGWHMCAIGDGSIDYRSALPRLAGLRPDAALSIEMPLRLWRPMRGAARFKPVPPIAQIAAELTKSRAFVEDHFRPGRSPVNAENGATSDVCND